jgi:hypothetical protein
MTESEWLACADSKEMIACLGEAASQRKLRLFVCVCFRERGLWGEGRAKVMDAILLAEQLADGCACLEKVQTSLSSVRYPRSAPSPITCLLHDNAFNSASIGSDLAAMARACSTDPEYASEEPWDAMDREQAKHPTILRDIFGNPFRPVAFDPAWRTDTALALARQMYESREFSAMPILADALQDAGCDNTDILSHCRDAGATHVRGCWVIDLVLGKS